AATWSKCIAAAVRRWCNTDCGTEVAHYLEAKPLPGSLAGRIEHGTWRPASLWCPWPGRWYGALARVGHAGGARGTRVAHQRRALHARDGARGAWLLQLHQSTHR